MSTWVPNAPRRFDRPGIVSLLAILDCVGAAVLLSSTLTVVAVVALKPPHDGSQVFVLAMMALLFGLIGVCYLAAGIGLWRLRGYGRNLQVLFACFGLLGFPIGTIISGLILFYLFQPGIKLMFSGRSPDELDASENAEVARATSSSPAVIAVVVIFLGFLGVAFVGIIAAIAIPSLLRARLSANEASTIGDTRSVISAQTVYQMANGGYYDGQLNCLAKPSECIPGYSGPVFLDATLGAGLPKSGYVRTLHPGPRASPGGRTSPSSVSSFAYTARPVTVGQTGIRGFCGDSTGVITFTTDGSEPEVVDGRCSGGRVLGSSSPPGGQGAPSRAPDLSGLPAASLPRAADRTPSSPTATRGDAQAVSPESPRAEEPLRELRKPQSAATDAGSSGPASAATRTHAAGPRSYERPPSSTTRVDLLAGKVALYIDGSRWKQTTKDANAADPTKAGKMTFQEASGEAFAITVSERAAVAPGALRKAVLANLQRAAPDARVVAEDNRQVNGLYVHCLQLEATINNVPLTYYDYVYTGPLGTVQVITSSARNLFPEHKAQMEAFLNGLTTVQ